MKRPPPVLRAAVLAACALPGMIGGRAASAQPRDLVLTDWDAGSVALRPGMTLENRVRSSPTGESLSRVTFTGEGNGYDLLTRVNLPPTAQAVSFFSHADGLSPDNQEALFTDSHGWTGVGRESMPREGRPPMPSRTHPIGTSSGRRLRR